MMTCSGPGHILVKGLKWGLTALIHREEEGQAFSQDNFQHHTVATW